MQHRTKLVGERPIMNLIVLFFVLFCFRAIFQLLKKRRSYWRWEEYRVTVLNIEVEQCKSNERDVKADSSRSSSSNIALDITLNTLMILLISFPVGSGLRCVTLGSVTRGREDHSLIFNVLPVADAKFIVRRVSRRGQQRVSRSIL